VFEQHQAEWRLTARVATDRALSLAREIHAKVDSLVSELRPGVFDALGLAASLRQRVRRWADCARVDTESRCDVGAISEPGPASGGRSRRARGAAQRVEARSRRTSTC
jgi:signal transduction histidine kinase